MCLHFFPRIPGVPEDPHDVLKKRDSASWSPAPSHLPPAPSCTEELHQPVSTAITTKQWDYSETRPPPRLDSLWGGRRPLYFFLLFLLFRQIHSIHSSFSPPCTGNSSNPSTVSRNWTIKTIPEGGKVPTKQKGPDLETCLDFLWEQRIDLIGWNLLQDLLNGPMVRCWWWRDYMFLFTGEKKKETKF